MTTWVAAVDFGATSVRVGRVGLGEGPPAVQVVHRVSHHPVDDGAGTRRWDWPRLVGAMEEGLGRALDLGPLASIGVDTWGVDYGLLGRDGQLVEAPVSYRDPRTAGYRAVVDRLGAETLFRRTGLQLQPFNTIFQLAAHDRRELARAERLLLLPELLGHHLTGAVTAEATSAGTTGLVDIATGDWATDLFEAVGVDPALVAGIAVPGTRIGSWRDIPVHLVGGHDTASAVAGMGSAGGAGAAFVSAGTWFLVGVERDEPDLSDRARVANVTNEVGAAGGYRVLKNLAGAWLLERCREQWGEPPVDDLLAAAAELVPGPTFDVSDERFLDPPDMAGEIRLASGLSADAGPPEVVRAIIDALAVGVAGVLDHFGGVTDVHLLGGASTWEPLRDRLGDLTGSRVHEGPVEATAVGNAFVQGVALGRYRDLADARLTLTPLAGP